MRIESDGPTESDGKGDAAWERIKELLADALERPTGDRRRFLERACGADVELRDEVISLLPDDDSQEAFLARPATELFDAPAPESGARIGRYILRDVIGEGGMGRVYEAEQEHPHRSVALKILRPGFLAADADRRFQWEIEALGRLNHPAVAKVYDAGVERSQGGQPLSWFAMEKVDGEPLLFAADALGLDRGQRLELFRQICEGVAHAHQRGIIHRDLKPDNILVDREGRPHILDFGIARTADPLASSVTAAGEIIGTLAYMSPEQLLGEPDKVDARSDVFALGVILFRLLTGQPPHKLEGLSLPQAALILSRDEARPAGTIDRTLRGDLETILATALAREADRRYPTVDALAADVRRSLANEPINARAATTLYQLKKFAQRNRGLVIGAAVAVVALVVGVVSTSVAWVRADRARGRAEIERDRARDANNFMNRIFASANPDMDGRDVRVIDLIETAVTDLAKDTEFDPAVRAGLHMTLGETLRHLGFSEMARDQLSRAHEQFLAADGPQAETTLDALGALCEVYVTLGMIDDARRAVSEFRAAAEKSASPRAWIQFRPMELDAAIAGATGDIDAYQRLIREVFEAWRARDGEGQDTTETARNNYAVALLENGHAAEAAELLTRGIQVRSAVTGPDHQDILTQRINLAQALSMMGRYEEALLQFEQLRPLAIQRYGPEHPKVLAIETNWASILQDLGRFDDARPIHEEIVRICREKFGGDHRESVVARSNLAVLHMQQNDFAAAEVLLTENLRLLEGPLGDTDPVLLLRTEMNLASALSGLNRREEARVVSARVVSRLEELVGPAHEQTLIARNNLSLEIMTAGETDEAVRLQQRNIELAIAELPDSPMITFPFRMNLGRALAAAGRFEEAERELLAVEGLLSASPNTTELQAARIREVIAEMYAAWSKPEEEARWR